MDENTKIKRTKAKLRTAFLKMIERKPLEEVTVSELCREAGINRTTFYKYYSLPQDIAEAYLSEMMVQTMSKVRHQELTSYEIMLDYCHMLQESPAAMLMLASVNGMEATVERFMLKLEGTSSLREEPGLYFVCGGISAVLTRWSRHEPDIPAEEIARILSDCLSKVLG